MNYNTMNDELNQLGRKYGIIEDSYPLYNQELEDSFKADMIAWSNRRTIEILKNFNPLHLDHTNCLDPRGCIGYQNADSDFDNEKEILISSLEPDDKDNH